MNPNPRPRRGAERGQVVLFAATLGVVLVGVLGFVVDRSRSFTAAQQLQAAADSAAMAAARVLRHDDDDSFASTRTAALDCAGVNDVLGAAVQVAANAGNDAAGDVVVGTWDEEARTFTADASSPNAVCVRARRTADSVGGALDLSFGSSFGASSWDVEAMSIAAVSDSSGPWLLVLEPTQGRAMRLNGTPDLSVLDGVVQVNSTASDALRIDGGPTLTADLTSVVGGVFGNAEAVSGDLVTGAPPLADPLADVLATDAAWNAYRNSLPKPLGNKGGIDASGVYSPGYYPRGLSLKNSKDVTLLPGVYMFGAPGIDLAGSATVTGEEVTLLVDSCASVDITGNNAGISLTPPTNGPFEGISIFVHRGTTSDKACRLRNGGTFFVSGITYVPSGKVDVAGNAGKEFGGIICDRVQFSGTSGFDVTGEETPGREIVTLVH